MDGLPVEEFPPPANLDGDAPEDGHAPYTPPPSPTKKPSPTKTTKEPEADQDADAETEPTDSRRRPSPSDSVPTSSPVTRPVPAAQPPTPSDDGEAQERRPARRPSGSGTGDQRPRRGQPARTRRPGPSHPGRPGRHRAQRRRRRPGRRARRPAPVVDAGARRAGADRAGVRARDGAEGVLLRATTWQDGAENYSHMCYSDLPFLYTGRGFVELNWPYTGDEQVRSRYDVMEYPVGIAYYAWGAAWVTHWLNGSPDLEPRFARGGRLARLRRRGPAGDPDLRRRQRGRLRARGAAGGLVAEPGASRAGPGTPRCSRCRRRCVLSALVNWDLLVVVLVAGALLGLGPGQAGADRRADRARDGHQAVPAAPARRRAGDLPARPAGTRLRC